MGHKKQAAGGKRPKETDAIKEKLQHYATFQRRIENKIERLVYLESRYFDHARWWAVSAALFGDMEDYEEHEKRYLKRTFKIHGSALQSLAKIYAQK